MARQATPGLDGFLRFSMNIPVRVGRAQLVDAVSYYRPRASDDLPSTRTEAKRLAKDYLAQFGTRGVAKLRISQERHEKVAECVDVLFSELKGGEQ